MNQAILYRKICLLFYIQVAWFFQNDEPKIRHSTMSSNFHPVSILNTQAGAIEERGENARLSYFVGAVGKFLH